MCFAHDLTGNDEDNSMLCSACGRDEPELEDSNTLRIGYIPILPRLRAMIREQYNCDAFCSYSRNWTSDSTWKTDVFDEELFKSIREKHEIDNDRY